MFCYKCGKEIDDEAIVCVHCGCATPKYQEDKRKNDSPIVINNNSSSSSSSASAASATAGYGRVRIRRKRSLIFDIFMICITGGLWIFWMIFRPKYY